MFYTGVDWSGDPGIPTARSSSSAHLAFAFVTIETDQREHLHHALAEIRQQHRLTNRFVFHYVDCPPVLAAAFFAAVRAVDLEIRIGIIDKRRDWNNAQFVSMRGQERLHDTIADLTLRLPDQVVDGSRLLIDGSRSERKFGLETRRIIRQSFSKANRTCFRDIRLCPDGNDPDGEIIQIADMVAGAVRRAGSIDNPHTRQIEKRLVEWEKRP